MRSQYTADTPPLESNGLLVYNSLPRALLFFVKAFLCLFLRLTYSFEDSFFFFSPHSCLIPPQNPFFAGEVAGRFYFKVNTILQGKRTTDRHCKEFHKPILQKEDTVEGNQDIWHI